MDTRIKLILLLTLFLISPVSAKFICGEVQSTDDTTPAWYEVKTYLASDENKFSTCQVSPSNNRYCCEISKNTIKYQWKAEDIFKTKITDTASGYFATPQNLILKGQGYDIAPVLTLEKAIRITQPNTTLTISQIPQQIKTNISSHCANTSISSANLNFGKNEITITTIYDNEEFKLEKTFYQIQNITFQKESPKKIKNKRTTTIKLQATLSHSIEDIQLKEYVPSSWKILNTSNNATIETLTPQYNVITWQVNGDTFDFNYKVEAPMVRWAPQKFKFKTEIDEHTLKENEVLVYKFIPFLFKPKPFTGGWGYNPKYYSKVSEIEPLIYQEKDFTAALYSRYPTHQESFNLMNFLSDYKFDRKFDYLKSYQIQTTLNLTERGRIVMEYKTNKTFMDENNYKEIGFFEKHGNKLLRITGAVIASSNDEIKYRFESGETPSEIYILAEKNNLTFWDKVLNFWDKIKFYQ